MTDMTYKVFQNDPEKISGIQGQEKNLIFFQDRSLKILFVDLSLNFEAILFKTV